MPRSLVAFFLVFAAFITSAEDAFDVPVEVVAGLAVAGDGTIWFAASPRTVGRIRPDRTVQTVELEPPFAVQSRAELQPTSDGGVLVGSYNGVIAKVSANLGVTMTKRADPDGFPLRFIPARDGTYWFVDQNRKLVQLTSNAVVLQERALSFTPNAATVSSDGTIYALASEGVYAGSAAGDFKQLFLCRYCGGNWIEVLSDGTVVFSGGELTPGGVVTLIASQANDSTLGPDGAVWLAGRTNSLYVRPRDSALDEIPLEKATDEPLAIAASSDAIWYSVPRQIRRISTNTRRDLLLREGDILAREEEQNCCFEGTHPVLAHHRRDDVAPFVRRLEWDEVFMFTGGVFALSKTAVLASWAGPFIANRIDATGKGASKNAGGNGGLWTLALAVDRNDTTYAIRSGGRLVTLDRDGLQQRDVAAPVEAGTQIRAVDLAVDQCTLFFVASAPTPIVGRMDACTATALPPFLTDLDDVPMDVRLTLDGDVLVAFQKKVVRYDRFGSVQRILPAGGHELVFGSIALDPDPRFLWIGTGSDLRRVDWSAGNIVESRSIYGLPTSLALIGEPRAARIGAFPKRRSAAH